MKVNSIGTFTTATEFVPLFQEPIKIFKPITYRQVNESSKTETQESASSASTETQSGITSQNQQTTPQTAEQANS